MQAVNAAVDFPLSELRVEVLLTHVMYSLPDLAAPRVQMFCFYKQQDGFHMNYYSTKLTCKVEKDKLHNIDLYVSRKTLCLQR